MATINDQVEQDWVIASFGSFSGVSRSLWIGLTDQANEGNFTWISGEPVLYTHWIAFQPDNALGNENYVHMINSANEFGHPGGLWNYLASPNTIFASFNQLNGVVKPSSSTRVASVQTLRVSTRDAGQGCAVAGS